MQSYRVCIYSEFKCQLTKHRWPAYYLSQILSLSKHKQFFVTWNLVEKGQTLQQEIRFPTVILIFAVLIKKIKIIYCLYALYTTYKQSSEVCCIMATLSLLF